MTTIGEFVARFRADTGGFDAPLKGSVKTAEEFAANIDHMGEAAHKTRELVGTAALGIGAAIGGLAAVVEDASVDFVESTESMQVQWTALLGSVSAANSQIDTIRNFAAAFGIAHTSANEASKNLEVLTHGMVNNTQTMHQLADAAATTGRPIETLAQQFGYLYDVLSAGGENVGIAVRQLVRGGLISQETSQQLGNMAKQGAAVSDMWNVIAHSLDRFHGAAEAQANTFVGLRQSIHDLRDEVVGGAFAPLIGDIENVMRAVKHLLEQQGVREFFKSMADSVEQAVGGFGGLTTAIDHLSASMNSGTLDSLRHSLGDLAPLIGTITGLMAQFGGEMLATVPIIGRMTAPITDFLSQGRGGMIGFMLSTEETRAALGNLVSAFISLLSSLSKTGGTMSDLMSVIAPIVAGVVDLGAGIVELAANFKPLNDVIVILVVTFTTMKIITTIIGLVQSFITAVQGVGTTIDASIVTIKNQGAALLGVSQAEEVAAGTTKVLADENAALVGPTEAATAATNSLRNALLGVQTAAASASGEMAMLGTTEVVAAAEGDAASTGFLQRMSDKLGAFASGGGTIGSRLGPAALGFMASQFAAQKLNDSGNGMAGQFVGDMGTGASAGFMLGGLPGAGLGAVAAAGGNAANAVNPGGDEWANKIGGALAIPTLGLSLPISAGVGWAADQLWGESDTDANIRRQHADTMSTIGQFVDSTGPMNSKNSKSIAQYKQQYDDSIAPLDSQIADLNTQIANSGSFDEKVQATQQIKELTAQIKDYWDAIGSKSIDGTDKQKAWVDEIEIGLGKGTKKGPLDSLGGRGGSTASKSDDAAVIAAMDKSGFDRNIDINSVQGQRQMAEFIASYKSMGDGAASAVEAATQQAAAHIDSLVNAAITKARDSAALLNAQIGVSNAQRNVQKIAAEDPSLPVAQAELGITQAYNQSEHAALSLLEAQNNLNLMRAIGTDDVLKMEEAEIRLARAKLGERGTTIGVLQAQTQLHVDTMYGSSPLKLMQDQQALDEANLAVRENANEQKEAARAEGSAYFDISIEKERRETELAVSDAQLGVASSSLQQRAAQQQLTQANIDAAGYGDRLKTAYMGVQAANLAVFVAQQQLIKDVDATPAHILPLLAAYKLWAGAVGKDSPLGVAFQEFIDLVDKTNTGLGTLSTIPGVGNIMGVVTATNATPTTTTIPSLSGGPAPLPVPGPVAPPPLVHLFGSAISTSAPAGSATGAVAHSTVHHYDFNGAHFEVKDYEDFMQELESQARLRGVTSTTAPMAGASYGRR